MKSTIRWSFSVHPRSALALALVTLVSVGALHCGADDPAASGPTAGGSGGGSAGNGGGTVGGSGGTDSAGAAGTSAGGSAAGGGSGGMAAGGTAGMAGSGAADPLEITQGCVGNYVDLASKSDAERKIEAFGVSWTPSCVEISAGQSIKWDVDYTTHPLRKGVRSDPTAGSPGNPIPDTDGGAAVTVSFPTPGFYPFYCNYHATPDGKGMIGLVHVK